MEIGCEPDPNDKIAQEVAGWGADHSGLWQDPRLSHPVAAGRRASCQLHPLAASVMRLDQWAEELFCLGTGGAVIAGNDLDITWIAFGRTLSMSSWQRTQGSQSRWQAPAGHSPQTAQY